MLLGDDAGAVEGMIEPKVGGEGMVRNGGDDAVFESVGDGAGQDVGGAAARMGDVDERDFDRFEGAVVVEIETGELAHAEFVVDVYPRMDFLAAIAVGFKADARFEQFDLCGIFSGFLNWGLWF